MKTKICFFIVLLAATLAGAQTNNLTTLLQQGLFEEQANRNLDAAIADYQSLAAQFDKDRQLAATAVFRLGECYRMQGKTNEAALEYQRIVNEFSDQTSLATLSRQNQAGLGPAPAKAAPPENSAATLWDKVKNLPPAELEDVLPTLVPDATLTQLMQQRGAAETKLAQLRVDYSTNYPDVQREDALLKTVNRQISEKIAGILQALKMRAELPQSAVAAAAPSSDEDQEIQRIQQMIQNSPDLINATSEGSTPLVKAAYNGWLKVAAYLLDHGADVNVACSSIPGRADLLDLSDGNGAQITPLVASVMAGNKAMAQFLIDRGANVNFKGRGGDTALHLAAQKGFQAVIEVLLASHTDVNAQNAGGATPLCSAVQSGQVKIVRMLLAAGADGNLKDSKGRTALNYAIRTSPEIFQALLGAGVNANTEDTNGRTPLSYATERDTLATVKLLLVAKANPTGGKLDAPLLCAIHNNDVVTAELLLQAGAKPDAKGTVDWIVKMGNLQYGPPGISSLASITPLWLAVDMKGLPMVQLLLKFKANPNDFQTDGRPLIFSALPQLDILAALLDAGADPNPPDNNVQNSRDWHGESPLMSAVGNSFYETPEGNLAAAKLLLAHGANPHAKDRDADTALHWVVGLGGLENWTIGLPKRELVELLLEHHANPNVRDDVGKTPLDLLKDKIAQNTFRTYSPETVAKQKAFASELADLLRQHGALDKLPDWDRITVSRPAANFSATVFQRGTNDWNHFTLLELIYRMYPNGISSIFGSDAMAFPDLAHIVVSRPSTNGVAANRIEINLLNATNGVDCTRDLPLEFGDVVEIPEREHSLAEKMSFLASGQEMDILNYLRSRAGEVKLVVADRPPAPVPLQPGFEAIREVLNYSTSRATLTSSSDLSRVKVTRRDPKTGKTEEWTVVCTEAVENTRELWLRAGDVIEVPAKP